jgi:hypothetical protein
VSLIPCKECGSEISSTAKACPKCGAEVPQKSVWPWVIGVPVGLIVLFLGYGFTIPEYESRARAERNVCYQLAGNSGNRYVCDDAYSKAIERGRAAGR